MPDTGTLYVVATPIGNLGDISQRALDTLSAADIIACENRNHHLHLLSHYGIKKRLIEISPANEKNAAAGVVKLLNEGRNIALVSDAGTPGLSDPGRLVVDKAYAAGVRVVPLPGPSAFATLISVSGFPASRVIFLGFLSKRVGKVAKELFLFQSVKCTVVLYVSPYQIKKILHEIHHIFGNVDIIIGREMTKLYESFYRGSIADIDSESLPEKGEYALAFVSTGKAPE